MLDIAEYIRRKLGNTNMNQPDETKNPKAPPPLTLEPTPKLARWIQYLQDNPSETESDWEAAMKAWDNETVDNSG